MISSLPQNFKELNWIWFNFDLIGCLTTTKFGRHVLNIYESKSRSQWQPWFWAQSILWNNWLLSNFECIHWYFCQHVFALIDYARLTFFFHISTLTFYFSLYCLSFGLATFFSLRYGESIVRFFLDKLIQRQAPAT